MRSMAEREIDIQQEPETPQSRYKELVAYYGQALADGRNKNRFPNNLQPEEVTWEQLYQLSMYMNEGWVGVTNTNIIEPQTKDPWFKNNSNQLPPLSSCVNASEGFSALPRASAATSASTTGESTSPES